MAAQAGWYPDPSGKKDTLRFWDGNAWTDDFMDYVGVQPESGAIVQSSAQSPARSTTQQPADSEVQVGQIQKVDHQQEHNAPNMQDQDNAGQPLKYQQPSYSTPADGQTERNPDGTYIVEDRDATLRLVAFIFYMIGIGWIVLRASSTFGLSLIVLAWLIPMGIHSWNIYKGTKPNTTAFGVCTLIFGSLIAGILLLVSKKDA